METFTGIGQFVSANEGSISAVAGAVGGFRQERQVGEIAQEVGDFEADTFVEQAKVAIQQGRQEALKLKRQGRRLEASNIAGVGAGGGLLTGSKLLAIADNDANIEFDSQQILRNAQRTEAGLLSQADISRFTGRQVKRAANIRAFDALSKGIKPGFQLIGKLSSALKVQEPFKAGDISSPFSFGRHFNAN